MSKLETKLEKYKAKLAMQPDFNLVDAFKVININSDFQREFIDGE